MDRTYPEKSCRVCGSTFTPNSSRQWRCSECQRKKLRPGPVPLCGCGCGGEVKWRRGKWEEYLSGHRLRVEKSYPERECSVCGDTYSPTTGSQWRCPNCSKKELRPDVAPLCGCGCGQPVNWKKGKWNEYLHGHQTRLNSPRKKGSIPWNKGQVTTYDHQCKRCGRGFSSKYNQASFCSMKCYHLWNVGANNVLWTGGRPKTKYKMVQINGKNMRAHRRIMAVLLGRTLRKAEVVHHIDEDGLNNNPDNLHLFHCDNCHKHHHRVKVPLLYEYPEAHRLDDSIFSP